MRAEIPSEPPWFELPDDFDYDDAHYPSTLTGWRSWRAAEVAGSWRLASTISGDVWHPGQRIEAVCRGRGNSGAAPCVDHGCGVYARKHSLPATYVTTGPRAAVGLVALWGRVIEHEYGYRAQFAYPVAFVEPTLQSERDPVRELAQTYGAVLI